MFYKELAPFERDGLMWNAFIWRVNKKIDSHYHVKDNNQQNNSYCEIID
jgi:hypothetical protein